jgi:plastocyanin
MWWRIERQRGAWALIACAGAILATACGPDPYDGVGAAPARPAGVLVDTARRSAYVAVLDNSFRDRDLVVPAGTEVVWTNGGRNDHDVIPTEFEADPASAPWGITAAEFTGGTSYSHVFDVPGVYTYLCTIHGLGDKGMAGTITVTG